MDDGTVSPSWPSKDQLPGFDNLFAAKNPNLKVKRILMPGQTRLIVVRTGRYTSFDFLVLFNSNTWSKSFYDLSHFYE